jgi:hypothetical protein
MLAFSLGDKAVAYYFDGKRPEPIQNTDLMGMLAARG